ncbi:hypothetical protein Q4603_20540 [Zobellia galactanivorans]|uniref:hypothetical protein n=1 Tax=Zobellia galactanivorans (strain DSM 12802 / CCUG 47099 / CIP 106680 / NCIMB 13871 / Dsij) TaxID=63186 RepID=UPI0026E2F478|nr:hypothetical protein [Zobellia galactanivorans]MDO6811021.1 hypothetical protein [Zobellia galactanivorans]
MEELKSSFDRKITHKTYPTQRKKNAFLAGYLPFEILEKPNDKKKSYVGINTDIIYLDDMYIVTNETNNILPLIIGGLSLVFIFFLILNFFIYDEWELSDTIFLIISVVILLFFIIYYFTIPKKQSIYDRKKELITFPGFLWNSPYTMPFKNIRLFKAGGAIGSPTADLLYVKRPDKIGSRHHIHLGGVLNTNLSFLVWYMDKNRPPPPGDAFDEYRKADYKRRKEEGFPPPIFRSFIPTREYKHKWQKERDKHWKDIIETDEKGNQVHRIWQSAENVERHGEWKPVVPQ